VKIGSKKIKEEFAEVMVYIKNTPEVSSVLVFVAVMSLLVLPFTTLTPVFAKDIFHGSAYTLGIIDGAIGLGAMTGALYLASLKQGTNLSKVLAINTLIFGLGLSLFSQILMLPLALLFIIIGAFGMMSIRTVSNTIIQLHVPNRLRGRIISIYLMILTLMMPIGSLLIGAVSHYTGVQALVLSEGIIALIIGLLYGRYLKKEKLKKEEQSVLQHPTEEELMQA
jgi:MFS family permease